MRSVLLATLALVAAAASGSAQTRLREYRAEVIVTMPRVYGFGVLFVTDQRWAMEDLSNSESVIGTGLSSPQFHRMSLAVEARQVKTSNGTVEHRYIPTFYFNVPLPAGFELRDRNRFEMRVVGGQWTQRYINRTAVGHNVSLLHWTTFPFVQSDAYYDVRTARWTRFDGTIGVRTPLIGASNIDTFVTRSSDRNRAPSVGITLGALMRVPL